MKAPDKFRPPMLTNGQVIQAASRRTRAALMTVYECIGGDQRLAEEADKDPKWFFEKLWVKNIQPEKEEATQEKSVADILRELDGELINVTPEREKDAEA